MQHEGVITVLNQRMAEKANEQIKLNETRDRLRNTQSKVRVGHTGLERQFKSTQAMVHCRSTRGT